MVVILIVGGEPSAPSPPFSSSTTVSIVSSGSQVSPDDQLAISKEEEWIKRKKVEVVTKRQIATRVQREVLLEDGKVVQDSGPKVTTTTTEDVEKQESENTEHHDIDGPEKEEEWVPAGDSNVLTEIKEKRITTREEKQETVETEDIKHLGNISDEAYKKAVGSRNVGESLEKAPGLQVATVGPRIIGQSTRTHRITDVEDTTKTTGIDNTGKITTNTVTTREHEEVNEEEVPEDVEEDSQVKKEKSHHYIKRKDQEFVDYIADGVKIGTEMRYNAETTEGAGEGEWDSLSERINKMRRGRFLRDGEQDRKDALTRIPLDFDQEERTRKAETSKWLEHHFGSESTSRSSKDSDEDAGNTSSFINVTMKSTKEPKPSKVFLSTPEPQDKLYFKGISEWKSEERKTSTSQVPGRVQVLPAGPNHTFQNRSKSPSPPLFRQTPSPLQNGSKPPSPQYAVVNKFPSTQNLERSSPSLVEKITKTTKYTVHERTSSPFGRSSPLYNGNRSSPINGKLNGKTPTPPREQTPPRLSPPPRRRNRKIEKEEEILREEPAPDYSPVSEHRSSPHRVTPDSKRKVYQRTRFAADIPPPPQPPQPPQQVHMNGTKTKSETKRGGLGQSFRRLVGKLRSNSGDRKKKGKKSGGDNGLEEGRVVDSGTQTPSDMQTIQRFYLGEDPFGGSIYGKESEYDGVQYRRKYRREEESRHHSSSQGSSTLGRLSKSTSRLAGNEKPVQNGTTLYYNDRGGVQTLPRKLQEDKQKKEVHVTRSNGEASDRYKLGNNSNSMFNVSIVNNVSSNPGYLNGSSGPTKPARTYRTNLLRSKSFNVHAGDPNRDLGRYTSNPQLHRLDESHAPLKSPEILKSISRSTRDISEALHEEDSVRRPLGTYDQNRYIKNGYNRSNIETKKKIFMKGLMERAPELYKTLHGNEADENRNSPEPKRATTPLKSGKMEYSTTFRTGSPLERLHSPVNNYSYTNGNNGAGSDINRSVVRRGSNDYTETIRYTTTSDDPSRPSVTNTVQSFSKKTIPSVSGRKETIEQRETKTITKSRFRSGTPDLKYLEGDHKYSGNGGVIIEVRNTRK